jgi:hypothetical protein
MKNKKPAWIAVISVMICGIGVLGFLVLFNGSVIPRHGITNKLLVPESNRPASISINTALLLLAAGVIGVLSVRRRNKSKRSPAQKTEPKIISEDRNKEFIKLNMQYLNMQYKITQHKFSGENQPDGLRKEIFDLERKVRLISRALE